MADNYTKVPKEREQESISPNEIRISSTGKVRRYISYGVGLLAPSLIKQDEADAEQTKNKENQKVYDKIVLKGMGPAITKTVTIAEIIKRRVAGLHQLNEVSSTTVVDEYEPKTEGLERTTSTRSVSSISITLSKTPLNTNAPGYQSPISADLVQPMQQKPKRTSNQKKKEESQSSERSKKDEQATTKTESPSANANRGGRRPRRGRGRGVRRSRGASRGTSRKSSANGQSASANKQQE